MINVTENFITFCDDMMIAEESEKYLNKNRKLELGASDCTVVRIVYKIMIDLKHNLNIKNIECDIRAEKTKHGKVINLKFKDAKEMKKAFSIITDVCHPYETDIIVRSSPIRIIQDPDEYEENVYHISVNDENNY